MLTGPTGLLQMKKAFLMPTPQDTAERQQPETLSLSVKEAY